MSGDGVEGPSEDGAEGREKLLVEKLQTQADRGGDRS